MATKEYDDLRPNHATHPGAVLADEIEARRISQAELARRMGRPARSLNLIVAGKRGVTAETALDLERVLGTDARFWLDLQVNYDLTYARLRRENQPA